MVLMVSFNSTDVSNAPRNVHPCYLSLEALPQSYTEIHYTLYLTIHLCILCTQVQYTQLQYYCTIK